MGVALVAVLALAGCGRDEDPPEMLVEYSGASVGIVRWTYEVRVRTDGTVFASGDLQAGCPAGPAEVKLEPPALDRLRTALKAARLDERKSVIEGGVNAQEVEIRAGGHIYQNVGAPLPRDLLPLVEELHRVMSYACGISQPGAP